MRISLLLIAATTFVAACSPSSHSIREQLHDAETLLEQAPDSALCLLEKLDSASLGNRAIRARHALLHTQALDKNYIDLANDSVIAPAVMYYANHGSNRDKAQTYFYLGRIRDNAGYPGEAAKMMLKAEKYATKAGATQLLGMIYNCRANLYYAQYSFEEALEMYTKADSCFRTEEHTAYSALMIKAQAKTYAMQKRYAKAQTAYHRAIELFDSIGNPVQASISTTILCTILLNEQQVATDSLKQLLQTAYDRYSQGQVPHSDLYLWARLHMEEGQIDSARHFCQLAMQYNNNNNNNNNSPDQHCGALSLMGRIEASAGNYREAAEYSQAARQLLDSITRSEKRQLIQQVERRYQNQELQYQNKLLRMHTRLLTSIGALVFTILLFTFMLILRHRHRVIRSKSKEIADHKELIGRLSDDYASLHEQYDKISVEIDEDSQEEAELLRALEKRLMYMHRLIDFAYSSECKPQAFYKVFKEQVTAMKHDELAFSDLQYLVNKRHHGIIDYLRSNYPQLTYSELNLLSMILFGFSFDCIRLIYNHDNVDSLYSRRTKIRDKLQLPPRYRIEKFLNELVEQFKREGSESSTGSSEKATNK